MSLEIVFFFYWKDCLGVYVSDIKRNQILLLSSTHLNIILRFDFKLRLCGSLVGMCFPASTAIYTLFLFPFSIREWTRLKNYENEFYARHMDWKNVIIWYLQKWNFEVKWRGRFCCNTVYEDQYPQSRKKIL